ncbi:acyl-CoA dehydrogenase family protein [Rhodococcus sp. CH91]|uniref:acyl-CoA dehydrogenase family protein n=1 Tax=Rhodococcus sp. CH91 TaxID=2910256 RepID=UPI001F4A85FB|nr:acyl-CoA dehydrogenase family protein [Rhodococcus sp. CH91]
MDFALSDEQVALGGAERAWLAKNDPIAARRPGIDAGPACLPAEGLRHLAHSGSIGLLTPETGGTHVDLAVLVEEHGRAGSAVPVAEPAIAASLLEMIGHPAAAAAEAGERIVLPALSSPEKTGLHARFDGDALTLSGTTAPITGLIDAHDLLLVAVTDTGAEVAAAVPVETLTVRTLETLDLTRSWAVADVDVTLPEDSWVALPAGTVAFTHDRLAAFRAVDALGAAARLVDMSVDHAGNRSQFGKTIGSFQAVKHHCANMATTTEASRAALWAAAVALDGDDPVARARAVSAAVAFACSGASTTAQTALQVHGGIGFTWEHDVHLLLRRIKVDELLDGSVSYHRRRLAVA